MSAKVKLSPEERKAKFEAGKAAYLAYQRRRKAGELTHDDLLYEMERQKKRGERYKAERAPDLTGKYIRSLALKYGFTKMTPQFLNELKKTTIQFIEDIFIFIRRRYPRVGVLTIDHLNDAKNIIYSGGPAMEYYIANNAAPKARLMREGITRNRKKKEKKKRERSDGAGVPESKPKAKRSPPKKNEEPMDIDDPRREVWV